MHLYGEYNRKRRNHEHAKLAKISADWFKQKDSLFSGDDSPGKQGRERVRFVMEWV